MKKLKNKLIAVSSCLFAIIIAIFFWWIGGHILIEELAQFMSTEQTRILFEGDSWPYDEEQIRSYYQWFLLSMAISFGMSLTFILWDFKNNFTRRLLIYISFLFPIIALI